MTKEPSKKKSLQKGLSRSVRIALLSNPEWLSNDADLLAAIALKSPSDAGTLVDIRHITIERQRAMLEKLETQHNAVVSAAYENMRAVGRIHNACLRMLEAQSLAEWEMTLFRHLPEILRVKSVRLIAWNKKSQRIKLETFEAGSRALIPIGTGQAIELRSSREGDFPNDSPTDYLGFFQDFMRQLHERLSE